MQTERKNEGACSSGKLNPLQRLAIAAIHVYQREISANRPPTCRFEPTCSAYALEAVSLHGFFKGGALALWRILRCNPWGGGGFDPVPGSPLDLEAKRLRQEERQSGKAP